MKTTTYLLLVSGYFQLSFFGWLPREVKFLGDLSLFLLLFYLLLLPSPEINFSFKEMKARKITKIFLIAFSLFLSFQILFSIITWGEPFLVLRQARRWIVISCYFMIILSNKVYLFDSKLILKNALVVLFILLVNIFIYQIGSKVPFGDSIYQAQGGVVVYKLFFPGIFIIYIFLMYFGIDVFTESKLSKSNKKNITFFVLLLLTVLLFLPFRSWVIASFISIFLAILIYLVSQKSSKRNLVWKTLTMVSCIFIALIITNRTDWLKSSFYDFENIQGSYLHRLINDITKLDVFNNSEYLINGIGFVHKSSAGADFLGFSSETNETGWIELVISGGIIGTVIFIGFYISIFVYLVNLFKKTNCKNILIILSVWLMSGVLMISSNLLLWDFGFVPITFIFIVFLNECKDTYEKNIDR